MPTKSVQDIVTDVRNRCDMAQSQYITDDELVSYINSAAGELFDILVSTSEDFQLNSADITLASSDILAGTNFIPMPATLAKLRGVDRLFGGTWLTCYRHGMAERNAWSWPSYNPPIGYITTWYRLQGSNIYLVPPQTAAGQYRVWYVPDYVTLAIDDDLPDYMATSSWLEFIIASVCSKVLQKQDLDNSTFEAQKAAQQLRIVDAAVPRDTGGVRRAVDTRSMQRNQGWGGGWGFNGGGDWS